jgi:L-lactate dehydrogenase complex protein LldF
VAKDAFFENTVAACADSALAAKLRAATERQVQARVAACREIDDVDALRDLAAALRDDVLAGLDGQLERFADKAEASGVHVHWAPDAAEARRIVSEVADSHGVQRIVKSKSMLTEEIGLTSHLEQAGLEVVETDLGEFIIQVARQGPSHIVIPAVHLSAADVAGIFEREIGYTGRPDPEPLTGAARAHLRQKFREAQMGISGVNFAVAEEGLWTICTNEGNGRYVAGLPKVYLAVMGIERIVRDMASAAVILKLLGRFATGQRITQYVNIIGGPSAPDGPEHVHLVILDNGRSRILGMRYWQMLRCIRCGACLNACPVFRRIGGQAFPGCYSGPMGSVLLPLQLGLDRAGSTAKACSLCRLCDTVCPVRIPLSEFLLELRADLASSGRGTIQERAAMGLAAWIMEHPLLYRLSQRALRAVLAPLGRSGWVGRLPALPGRWTGVKDLPLPARRSYLSQVRSGRSGAGGGHHE